MLQQLKDEGCFGDFWKDIFSMKITTKKDRERTKQGVEKPETTFPVEDFESSSKQPTESGFNKYVKKVMLFNSTPKVNLVGKSS